MNPRPIIVADTTDLQKLAEGIPMLTVDGKNNGNSDARRYIPVLTTGREQLILFQNGNPVMSYKVAGFGDSPSEAGVKAIEQFLDGCHAKKHLVMLYDDPSIARRIEFRYLRIGLERGDYGIYAIPEDDVESPESIRAQMEEYGIDASYYLKNGTLRFVSIPDPAKDPSGFRGGCVNFLSSLTAQISNTAEVRMVLHVRYRFNTREEVSGHVEFENLIESTFSSFPGAMLCNHYIGRNTIELHGEWTKEMLRSHDNVFLVSAHGGLPFLAKSA